MQAASPCEGFTPTITGTNGDDNITGTEGPDIIVGLGDDDTITFAPVEPKFQMDLYNIQDVDTSFEGFLLNCVVLEGPFVAP